MFGESSSEHFNDCSPPEKGSSSSSNKRKRRPAGTPDPDAEVVSLSPKTLLESDRYVCEICNQGFQRDQNLQMHRRRHKVPWKLLKRENPVVKKRVFVCPEPTCLHHDPCHALGDLVGIKKHFRRKHSNHRQWVCQKCSKAYAVQSDYKAHLKTCGTRGHSCDCGRVFSRVESFIEHQDACHMGRLRPTDHHDTQPVAQQQRQVACLSRTTSSSSPSNDTAAATATWNKVLTMTRPTMDSHNLELHLSVSPKGTDHLDNQSTQLQLSIGSSDIGDQSERGNNNHKAGLVACSYGGSASASASASASSPLNQVASLKEQASEQLRQAMADKACAEEARIEAKRQIELAEREFDNAKRIRQQAQAELDKAQALKEHSTKQISSALLQITCHACKQQFQAATTSVEATLASLTSSFSLDDQTSSLAESQVQKEGNQQ